MENNSFLTKFTKSKIAFITLIIVIIATSITTNYLNNIIFQEYAPEFAVKATRLNQTPTNFIHSDLLGSYGIEQIFNSTTGVQISFFTHNQIRELLSFYDTYNIEYKDNYYALEFDFIDNTADPPSIPGTILILSAATSIILSIAMLLIFIIILVNLLTIVRRAGLL